MIGGIRNLLLGEVLFYCRQHAAHIIDLLYYIEGLFFHPVCKRFNKIRPSQRVDCIRHPGFLSNDLLCPQRNGGCLLSWYGQDLVEGIGVERLGPAHNRRQCLKGRSYHIIIGLLSRERTPSCLGVESQPPRSRVFCLKPFLHDLGPHPPGRPELGHLFKKIEVRIKKEGKPGRKVVHIKTALHGLLCVSNTVSQGKGQFLNSSGACLPDMISTDADGIPPRDFIGSELHCVFNNSNRGHWRTHEGLLRNKLLEHIVLDRPAYDLSVYPSLFRHGDIHGPDH